MSFFLHFFFFFSLISLFALTAPPFSHRHSRALTTATPLSPANVSGESVIIFQVAAAMAASPPRARASWRASPFFPFFIFFAHLKLSSIYPPSRGLASPSRSPSLPSPDSAPERPGTARVLGTSASVWWHADAGGDVQLQGGGVLRMQWGA